MSVASSRRRSGRRLFLAQSSSTTPTCLLSHRFRLVRLTCAYQQHRRWPWTSDAALSTMQLSSFPCSRARSTLLPRSRAHRHRRRQCRALPGHASRRRRSSTAARPMPCCVVTRCRRTLRRRHRHPPLCRILLPSFLSSSASCRHARTASPTTTIVPSHITCIKCKTCRCPMRHTRTTSRVPCCTAFTRTRTCRHRFTRRSLARACR